MSRGGPLNQEIARILEAESEARRAVEQVQQQARRIDEDTRRRASEVLAQARGASSGRRDGARAERIARADQEVVRIRAEAEAEAEAVNAQASQHLDAAVESVLVVLLAEFA